jgi:hypothetical protein
MEGSHVLGRRIEGHLTGARELGAQQVAVHTKLGRQDEQRGLGGSPMTR